MSEEIINRFNELSEKIGINIDWSSPNVISYLQDLMNRFISLQNGKAIIWIVISVIMIILTILLTIFLIKLLKKEKDEENISKAILIGITLLIISLTILISNIFGLMQNIYTPEISLLEYIDYYYL